MKSGNEILETELFRKTIAVVMDLSKKKASQSRIVPEKKKLKIKAYWQKTKELQNIVIADRWLK